MKYQGGYRTDHKQYIQMTESFLRKYPYLRGEASYIDSNTDWKEKLKNLFRDTRKHGDRNVLMYTRRKENKKINTHHKTCGE